MLPRGLVSCLFLCFWFTPAYAQGIPADVERRIIRWQTNELKKCSNSYFSCTRACASSLSSGCQSRCDDTNRTCDKRVTDQVREAIDAAEEKVRNPPAPVPPAPPPVTAQQAGDSPVPPNCVQLIRTGMQRLDWELAVRCNTTLFIVAVNFNDRNNCGFAERGMGATSQSLPGGTYNPARGEFWYCPASQRCKQTLRQIAASKGCYVQF